MGKHYLWRERGNYLVVTNCCCWNLFKWLSYVFCVVVPGVTQCFRLVNLFICVLSTAVCGCWEGERTSEGGAIFLLRSISSFSKKEVGERVIIELLKYCLKTWRVAYAWLVLVEEENQFTGKGSRNGYEVCNFSSSICAISLPFVTLSWNYVAGFLASSSIQVTQNCDTKQTRIMQERAVC